MSAIEDLDDGDLLEDVVEIPITDELDLHPFLPSEIRHVVADYVDAAYEEGYRELRLIHGRGKGVQREAVRKVLSHDKRVIELSDAPGNWGATLVKLGDLPRRTDGGAEEAADPEAQAEGEHR